jgi:TonB family protein
MPNAPFVEVSGTRKLGLAIFATALAATPAAPALDAQAITTLEQANAAVMDYYPAAARAAGTEGWATVKCAIDHEGLADCAFATESPAGAGFGQAALALSTRWPTDLFRSKMIASTKPPTHTYSVNVRFTFSLNPPAISPNPLLPTHVVAFPDWDRVHTRRFSWAGPIAARDNHVSGDVLLGCDVATTGKLRDCTITSESPEGWGFGNAALSSTPAIRMTPMSIDGVPIDGAHVNIPVRYRP